MTLKKHQKIIDDLQEIIIQTIGFIHQFEEAGMHTLLIKDYKQLHETLAEATASQRKNIAKIIAKSK